MRYGRTDLAHLKSGDNENMINDQIYDCMMGGGEKLLARVIGFL